MIEEIRDLTQEEIERNRFRASVTNTAFNATLSKYQVQVLLALLTGHSDCYVGPWGLKTFSALKERGLIRSYDGSWELTEGGRLMAELLVWAGYK